MCSVVSPPPLPALPTLAQDPAAWILSFTGIIGIPYVVIGMRNASERAIPRGLLRSFGIFIGVLVSITGLIAGVTHGIYNASEDAISGWHDRLSSQLSQQQCSTTVLDAAYSHAVTQIEPFHVIYQLDLACMICLYFTGGGYLIYLWWRQNRVARNG